MDKGAVIFIRRRKEIEADLAKRVGGVAIFLPGGCALKLYRTDALVLRTVKVREADLLVVLFLAYAIYKYWNGSLI